MLGTPEKYFDRGYGGYYSLPKQIGSVSPAILLEIAEFNIQQAERSSASAAVPFQKVAASSYVEAMLITDDPEHENLDDILDNLDLAESYFRQAADGEYALLEKGFVHPDYQDNWQRAELQCDFMNVFRDIVCGDVTMQTRDEIIKKLNSRLEEVRVLTQKRRQKNEVHGLLYELIVLKDIWQNYKGEGDAIALPSTCRGGDGNVNVRDTHDIDLASLHDGTWVFDPRGLEVKGGEGHKEEDFARYNCPIAHVSRKGDITIIDHHVAPN